MTTTQIKEENLRVEIQRQLIASFERRGMKEHAKKARGALAAFSSLKHRIARIAR
jgi:hypothetical protein